MPLLKIAPFLKIMDMKSSPAKQPSRLACNSLLTLLAIVFSLTTGNLSAQPEAITPDRPGAAEGTHAVTPGHFYIELGYQYSFRDKHKMSSVPDITFRFGVVDRVEMFIFWDGFHILHKGEDTDTDLPGMGGKYRLLMNHKFNLTLWGAVGFSEIHDFAAEPALAVAWDYELTDNLEIFGTAMSGYAESYFDFLFVVGIEKELSEKTAVFAEYYFTDPGMNQLFHGTEFGIAYLLTNNIQLDAYGGYGMSEEIEHYIGFGLSKRL